MKKASQVFYLHFALKKRAFIEEIHEKQEQVCAKTLISNEFFLLDCVSLRGNIWLFPGLLKSLFIYVASSFDVVFFEISH